MVKTISSRSSLLVPEQVDDQGMRDGIGVHTIIRGSEYVKGKINHQLQKFTPLGLIS